MKELFQRYYEKTATAAETAALMQWMADPANEAEVVQLMRGGWDGLTPGEALIPTAKGEAMLQHILPQGQVRQLRPVSRFGWRARVAAAAMIILLLSAGAYLLRHRQSAPAVAQAAESIKNDVMPGGNKAVLTLANGATIVLDSAGKGLLAQQGGTAVNKLADGQLQYNAGQNKEAVGYNMISTPRGGQYQVVLPDGSRVWLNAASSLRFPTAFSGRERNVELTGEAYFEIEKNREKPFQVLVNGLQIEVLGTHFNVMAYGDEAAVKTSLLEGRVRVVSGGAAAGSRTMGNEQSATVLLPGQQGSLDKQRHVLVVDKEADIDKAVAWKNGLFDFENDDISTIMRQLSRWYDVKIMFNGPVPQQQYTGGIRRQVPVSQVLHMLQLAGGVSFDIEGNTITVQGR